MQKDLYVRFVPYTGSHKPKGFDPVAGNLRMDTAFYVIDINSYADVDEAYFGIVDNKGRPIWLSNRYLRVVVVSGSEYPITSDDPEYFRKVISDISPELTDKSLASLSKIDSVNGVEVPIEIYRSKTPGKDYLAWYRKVDSN